MITKSKIERYKELKQKMIDGITDLELAEYIELVEEMRRSK
jgi:hypothetical protein